MPELIGKNVLLRPEGKPRTYSELERLLGDINVRDGLRFLGELYSRISDSPTPIPQVNGVFIPRYVIPPIALELILASDDSKTGHLDDFSVADLVDCFHNLPAAPVDEEGAAESLIRMGQAELSFQRRDPYRLERIVRLLRDIWPKVPQAVGLDVQHATQSSFGLGLDETLLLGFAFSGRSKQGYLTAYAPLIADHPLAAVFTSEAQTRFLEALATSYQDVRTKAAPIGICDELRRYRFNPLALTPLVRPDIQPLDARFPVYVVPCPKFMLDRVSDGLICDLRKHFGAQFDNAFGHAVEAYVGDLLRSSYGDAAVRGEFRYSHPNGKRLSPDWTVLSNGTAIVIEVKKTLLRASARTYGALDQVREDLEDTLKKAMTQLSDFRRQQERISGYPLVHDTECVIVTWDDSWWANSILKDLIAGLPNDMFAHVVSVREIERILARCAAPDDFYRLLWSKRCAGPPDPYMDMADWLPRLPGGADFVHLPILTRTHEEFFTRYDIEPLRPGPV